MLNVRWASDGQATSLGDMGVNHRNAHVFVAQEFLDSANVVSGFQEVSSEGVAEGMRRNGF